MFRNSWYNYIYVNELIASSSCLSIVVLGCPMIYPVFFIFLLPYCNTMYINTVGVGRITMIVKTPCTPLNSFYQVMYYLTGRNQLKVQTGLC
jgi:hypothetical protein